MRSKLSYTLIMLLMFFCPIWAEEYKGIPCGTWIEISAIPHEDYHFVRWNDGNEEAVRQIQVNEDATYFAYFAANCQEYANWPIVALYDWLLMINVRAINEQGYYFDPEDVTWYRVVDEPDDMRGIFPYDDQMIEQNSYYLTLDKSLKGTGSYYAVVDVSDVRGVLCDGLMRTEIVCYSGTSQPSRVALMPNNVIIGQTMQLKGLIPEEETYIYVYSMTGQVVSTFRTTGESIYYLEPFPVAGCYQVKVVSPTVNQTLRYIVNNE